MLDIGIGAAFVAGLLSFFSPCVLPIVPPYLGWLAGLSFNELQDDDIAPQAQRRIVLAAMFFVFGFSTVFILLGATASVLGQALARYFDILAILAGGLIFIMGLHFLGVIRIGFLYREARVNVERKPAGAIGAYVMGLAFAFGWTPCVGPILAAILFVAASQETAWHGGGLLAVYAAGIGIPFFMAGVFASRFIRFAGRFRKHMRKIEIAVGLMLIVTGVLFMTGQMARIAQWMIDTFPALATVG